MRFVDPVKDTAEGKLLAIVRDIEKAVGIEKNSTYNYECNMGCEDPECKTCGPKGVAKGEFNEGLAEYDPKSYKDFDWDSVTEEDLDAWGTSDENMGRQYGGMGRWDKEQLRGSSTEGPLFARFMHKRRGPGERGAKMQELFGKEDATREFIRKYVQESSGDNVKPMFMEISGKTEIPAAGYQGNQVLPFTEDASESKAISEVFKMPSVAQTGYDKDSSSLHMHFNDGGDYDYRAKVEESLAEIKKQATVGQQGVVEEIAGLIESIYARL